MDYLWTPWRYAYVSSATVVARADACLFCGIAEDQSHDDENLVVLRAEKNFLVLNRYPYNSGHLMIVPYEHVATLGGAATDTLEEMMRLGQRAENALRQVYRPEGFNLGLNIGQSAGAGVAAHIHMHALPRWAGDTSFMTTVGETRVLPEDLRTTRERLQKEFAKSA